jgi:hypothetical protein
MEPGDQVELRCSYGDARQMEPNEAWKMGTIIACDDLNFQVEFIEEDGHHCETFPMALFEQREARLIPMQTFSSMFHQ